MDPKEAISLIRQFVAEGKLKEAAQQLISVVSVVHSGQTTKWYNNAVSQLSQLNELEEKESNGIIREAEAGVIRNKIRAALLYMATKLEEDQRETSIDKTLDTHQETTSPKNKKKRKTLLIWSGALFLLLLGIWFLPGLGRGNREDPQRIFSLVSYQENGMSGVIVTLHEGADCKEGNAIASKSSNETGHVIFEKMAPGPYSLSARVGDRKDFAPACIGPIDKNSKKAAGARIRLCKNDLQITYPKSGALVDAQRPTFKWDPYPGARQYLISIIQQQPLRTLEESTLPAGTRTYMPNTILRQGLSYRLKVEAKDFASVFALGEVDFKVGQPTNSIYGQVTYLEEGISGIPIALIRGKNCNKNNIIQRTQTDQNGDYLFSNVSAGWYAISVNGWNRTGTPVAPYGDVCYPEYEKVAQRALRKDYRLFGMDLRITYPSNYATLNTRRPTIRWDPYPRAFHYKISLIQTRPVRASIESARLVTGTSFRPVASLASGRSYEVLVWAVAEEGRNGIQPQIGLGQVFFEIQ